MKNRIKYILGAIVAISILIYLLAYPSAKERIDASIEYCQSPDFDYYEDDLNLTVDEAPSSLPYAIMKIRELPTARFQYRAMRSLLAAKKIDWKSCAPLKDIIKSPRNSKEKALSLLLDYVVNGKECLARFKAGLMDKEIQEELSYKGQKETFIVGEGELLSSYCHIFRMASDGKLDRDIIECHLALPPEKYPITIDGWVSTLYFTYKLKGGYKKADVFETHVSEIRANAAFWLNKIKQGKLEISNRKSSFVERLNEINTRK